MPWGLRVMDLVKEYVRRYLVVQREAERDLADAIGKLEADGHRIIDGGQTGPATWQYTDWHTGEIIASGDDRTSDDEVLAALDPDGAFLHIDNVVRRPVEPDNPGIPPSLARALEDWVDLLSTPDEEIARYVGWTVQDVAAAR
ncbi:hypothetical protein GCM10009679_53520 [Saccharothrix algeriensis]|uniref:Uncharacterized protein n=2 Tax=Catellatospora bangladeshensis TaxID=310355 RepID=A0A8J3JGV6_9ACTN|nr:hypothetical protein Cba03nite_17800 [Catellatospora bangladeshensis]